MAFIDQNASGLLRTSTPKKDDQQREAMLSQETANLLRERNFILTEVNQMADFGLQAVRERSGNIFQYQSYVNAIQDRKSQIQSANETILKLSNFASEQDYLEMRNRIGNDALQLDVKLIEIQHVISEIQAQARERPVVVESVEGDRRSRKLETLRLEKFNGTVESWLSFWKRFEERVHNNGKLTIMEKYDYLRQYCTQNVLNKLKTIPLSEEFYDTAVDRLKEEFGSQERVMSHFTEKLLHVNSVQSRYDLDGLRALVQVVKSSVTALEGVGLSADHVSPFFWPILRKSLPADLYLEFKTNERRTRHGNQEANLSTGSTSTLAPTTESFGNMIDFLETICEDMSSLDIDKLRQMADKHKVQDRSQARTPTVAALPMTSKTEAKNKKKIESECLFCKDSKHRTEACRKEMLLDEKKQLLVQERRCFRCTRAGHSSRECRSPMFCDNCQKKNHVTSLCRGQPPAKNVNCCAGPEENSARNFMTVEALAYGPGGKKKTVRILFDTAAEISFVNKEFVRALGIDLDDKPKTQIPIRMFDKATTIVEATRVEFRLQSGIPSAEKIWISCQAVNQLVEGEFKPQIDEQTEEQLRQHNVQLADRPETERPIEIVIGLDHFVEFQTHNAVQLTKTLEVVETRLGWSLFGRRNPQAENTTEGFRRQATACLVTSYDVDELSATEVKPSESDETLDVIFRRFVEADALQLDAEKEIDDQDFIDEFTKTMAFDEKEKRFVVRLPLKEDIVPSENKGLCLARLRSLEARLRKAGLREKYQAEFEEMIRLGFIERVNMGKPSGRVVSYLPHREVLRESSLTTKLRIVFDASAKEKGKRSVNESMRNAPNLHMDLLGILLNFRRYGIVLTADIEKSFPQIVIHEDDRDALRLLWDFDRTGQPQEFRLARNYFGLAPSPFILAACIRRLISSYRGPHQSLVNQIGYSYYVDDLVMSVEEPERAARMYEVARALFSGGSFSLRKWFSNSEDLMVRFRQDDVSVEKFVCEGTKELKVLGLKYDGAKDVLRLDNPKGAAVVPATLNKRKVLSMVASVFDRLGILAPVILKAKLIMQDIYKISKMRWDDEVPESIRQAVVKWSKDLQQLQEIEIPRRYQNDGTTETKVEIHLFSDASVIAYGVVVHMV